MVDALAAGYTDAFRAAAVIIALAVPIGWGFLRLHPRAVEPAAHA